MLKTALFVLTGLTLGVLTLFAYQSWKSQSDLSKVGLQGDIKGLLPCPDKPNCVSSLETRDKHRLAPLLSDQMLEAEDLAQVKELALALGDSELVSDRGDYVHIVFRSALFRYPDDLELWLKPDTPGIQFRSASRVGHSDLGVNRQRVEQLRSVIQSKR